MYYRKYFAGNVEDASLRKNITNISNNAQQNHYYIIGETVCYAIKEALDDVGITCQYDDQNNVLTIDGVDIQFYCYSNSYIYFIINGLSLGYITNSPFSGNYYKFYITLKGDIRSILNISIGYYSSPGYESYGISLGKGTDLKDGSVIRVINTISEAVNSNFYIIKNNAIFADCTQKITFGQALTNIASLNNNGCEITMAECLAQPGRFKLSNCYFGHAALTNSEFYNINGDIYYKLSSNILVKCPDETIT